LKRDRNDYCNSKGARPSQTVSRLLAKAPTSTESAA
jgi:ribosomal protein S16